MIGVVAGRPVARFAALGDGQKIGDRDRLAMGDQKAVIGAFERRPAAHPGRRPRTQQIDRRTAAEIVPPAIGREMPLMRAPAELGRLRALADKAVDRPGVDELARLLRRHRHLGIALGDMDGLDAEALGETRPLAAAAGNTGAEPRVAGEVGAGEVEKRLLDEMRDEARIGAVRHDRGRALEESGGARRARSRAARSWSAPPAAGSGRCSRPATARCRYRDRARPFAGRTRSAPRSTRRPKR